MEKVMIDQNINVLHFKAGNVNICADLKYIDKAILLVKLNPFPGGPYYLAGLMNYAGKSIPVIDLCLYLGLHRSENYSLETPIMICVKQDKCIGLIVDEINDMSLINEENVQLRDDLETNDSSFIAVIREENKLSLLLNLDYILSKNTFVDLPTLKFDRSLINEVTINHE